MDSRDIVVVIVKVEVMSLYDFLGHGQQGKDDGENVAYEKAHNVSLYHWRGYRESLLPPHCT